MSARTAAPVALPHAPAAGAPGILELAFMLAVTVAIANPAVVDLLSGHMPRPDPGRLDIETYLTGAEGVGATRLSLLVWASAFAASGVLFLRFCLRRAVLVAAFPLAAFCLYLAATALWSDDPGTTAQRALALGGKTVFALYVAVRAGPERAPAVVAAGLAVVVAGGWLVAAIEPAVGWQVYRGGAALRGMFTHKTGYGVAAGLLLVLCLGALATRAAAHRGPLPAFGAALATVSLAAAQSVTAVVAAVAGAALLFSGRWVRAARGPAARRARLSLLSVVAVAALALSLAQVALVTEWMGRDVTLTARTEIWRAILATDGVAAPFGHGYFAFWRLSPGGDLYEIVARQGFLATSPHNAFLLAWLDGGWPGLCLFVWLVGLALTRPLRATLRGDVSGPLTLGLAAAVASVALVESNLFKGQQIAWMILVLAVVGPVLSRSSGGKQAP